MILTVQLKSQAPNFKQDTPKWKSSTKTEMVSAKCGNGVICWDGILRSCSPQLAPRWQSQVDHSANSEDAPTKEMIELGRD